MRISPTSNRHKCALAPPLLIDTNDPRQLKQGTQQAGHCALVVLRCRASLNGTPPLASLALCLQAEAHLSPLMHDAMALRIGIGYGKAMVGTLRAAGHKFLIVGGREANLATDLVTMNAASRVDCRILITESVYKEIQFAVTCFPRVLFDGTLLWEPVATRERESVAEEWMYELQQQQRTGGPTGEVMRSVFDLVRRALAGGKGNTFALKMCQSAVASMKEKFHKDMHPQNVLALDVLASLLTCSCSPICGCVHAGQGMYGPISVGAGTMAEGPPREGNMVRTGPYHVSPFKVRRSFAQGGQSSSACSESSTSESDC